LPSIHFSTKDNVNLLEDFPTVTKEQAVATLEIANKFLTSKNVEPLYETVLDKNF